MEVLREATEEVDVTRADLPKFIDDLYQTMHASDGVGLAAPQVGKAVRIFVIDADELKDLYPETEGFRRTIINPTILEYSDELVSLDEGCLSLPGISEPVKRPSRIRVKYQTLDGEWVEEVLEGFNARVFQHEYDHLEGILFTDKVAPMRRQMLRGKLSKLSKGKVNASYRTITK